MRTQYVSPAEVSEALGVSVSTVKRWVDDGVLPAHKTPGGHRKLLLADVLRLSRESHFPELDLSKLGGVSEPFDTSAANRSLFLALRRGNEKEAEAIILKAYRAGSSPAQISDEIIAPAMYKIGHEWEDGRIEVMHEHRGSKICESAIYSLKRLVDSDAEKRRPVAVGGAPSGDHYVLPSLMAQISLCDIGYHGVNLGPHTPMASFERAVQELKPSIIWVSVSHIDAPREFLEGYQKFYRIAKSAGVAVAIGGRALDPALRAKMPCSLYGDNMQALTDFARSMHPRKSIPRRGRPPLTSD